jgi:ubiquinone biosynthesis protein Coq4
VRIAPPALTRNRPEIDAWPPQPPVPDGTAAPRLITSNHTFTYIGSTGTAFAEPTGMRLPHLEYLTGLKGFLNLMRDPTRVDSVFDIVEGFHDTEPYRRMIGRIRSFPENARIIDERYVQPSVDLRLLALLPEGSLGREYARLMIDHKLDPNFFPKVDLTDETHYVMLRLRQTHDLWHVITGFGVDVKGELGLQAFGLAQLHNPLSVALIAGGLLRGLREPDGLDPNMGEVTRGWQMGRVAKQLFAQKWDKGWDKPVKIWREELQVRILKAD